MAGTAKRARISIDVPPDVRRRLRRAAAKRDLPMRRYVLEALEKRLRYNLGDGGNGMLALTAKGDQVLAELWANEADATYGM